MADYERRAPDRFFLLLLLLFTIGMEEIGNISATKHDDNDSDHGVNRMKEYQEQNHSFPIRQYVPNTPGWKKLHSERLSQVAEIEDRNERYEAYIQTLRSALIVPNYTTYGVGLTRCSDSILRDLQTAIRDGFDNVVEEPGSNGIEAPNPPWFIHRPDLTVGLIKELQPLAEDWSGMELTPSMAYGFRLYRNQSRLHMHLDRIETHVVSIILHIGSSQDSQGWPLFIEAYDGNTYKVVLKPGDALLYESAKCFHGRPEAFSGSWYTSVFVHYYPKYGWSDQNFLEISRVTLPPHWDNPHEADGQRLYPELSMVGTSMREPACRPQEWCRTRQAKLWQASSREGSWIAPDLETIPLHSTRSLQQADEEL